MTTFYSFASTKVLFLKRLYLLTYKEDGQEIFSLDEIRNVLSRQEDSEIFSRGFSRKVLDELIQEGFCKNHPEDFFELTTDGLKFAEESIFGRDVQIENLDEATRIVVLSFDEIVSFVESTNKVLAEVRSKNRIGEVVNLKEVILGQLGAGNEMLREGCIQVYAMQATLLNALTYLSKRYERETVGALASALLAAITKRLGLG